MTLKITADVAMASLAAAVAQVEVGPEEELPSLSIFSGPVPVNATEMLDVEANDVLAAFELPSPAFGAPAEIEEGLYGTLAYAIDGITALAAGEASFFRIYNKDGNPVFQGLVAEDDSTALQVNQVNITEGAEVSIVRLIVAQSLG